MKLVYLSEIVNIVANVNKAREVIVRPSDTGIEISVYFDLDHYQTFSVELENENKEELAKYIAGEIATLWEKDMAIDVKQLIEFVSRKMNYEKKKTEKSEGDNT